MIIRCRGLWDEKAERYQTVYFRLHTMPLMLTPLSQHKNSPFMRQFLVPVESAGGQVAEPGPEVSL